ncbi:MAG: hypothetical protein ACJ8HI_09680 [Massilia sp.]
MRSLCLFAAVLLTSSAFADEPGACYTNRDTTGDFVPGRMQPTRSNPETAAQVAHLLNENSRTTSRCMEKFMEREGGWPGGGGLVFGARIAPTGEVTQVSVVNAQKINDGMLMACIGRSICEWKLQPSSAGSEQLIVLPPFVFRARMRTMVRAPAARL